MNGTLRTLKVSEPRLFVRTQARLVPDQNDVVHKLLQVQRPDREFDLYQMLGVSLPLDDGQWETELKELTDVRLTGSVSGNVRVDLNALRDHIIDANSVKLSLEEHLKGEDD